MFWHRPWGPRNLFLGGRCIARLGRMDAKMFVQHDEILFDLMLGNKPPWTSLQDDQQMYVAVYYCIEFRDIHFGRSW